MNVVGKVIATKIFTSWTCYFDNHYGWKKDGQHHVLSWKVKTTQNRNCSMDRSFVSGPSVVLVGPMIDCRVSNTAHIHPNSSSKASLDSFPPKQVPQSSNSRFWFGPKHNLVTLLPLFSFIYSFFLSFFFFISLYLLNVCNQSYCHWH